VYARFKPGDLYIGRIYAQLDAFWLAYSFVVFAPKWYYAHCQYSCTHTSARAVHIGFSMVEGGSWPQFSSGVALGPGRNSGLRSGSCIISRSGTTTFPGIYPALDSTSR